MLAKLSFEQSIVHSDCTPLQSIVSTLYPMLHCTTLHYTSMNCNALRYTALLCTTMHHTAPTSALHSVFCIASLYFSASQHIALHHTFAPRQKVAESMHSLWVLIGQNGPCIGMPCIVAIMHSAAGGETLGHFEYRV